jgi:hypothetical protein
MIVELTLEERAAVDHATQALGALANMLYAAGLHNQGDDASVSVAVLERLLARDLVRTPT